MLQKSYGKLEYDTVVPSMTMCGSTVWGIRVKRRRERERICVVVEVWGCRCDSIISITEDCRIEEISGRQQNYFRDPVTCYIVTARNNGYSIVVSIFSGSFLAMINGAYFPLFCLSLV